MSQVWPLQSQCDAFYGDPRGRTGADASSAWRAQNLVQLKPPFKMAMGATPILSFPVHKKCKDAFAAWLEAIWKNAGQDPKTIEKWGMNVFSGTFCYRPMRGLTALSMHAYGCAIDIDAPRNAQFNRKPNFLKYREQIIDPFLKLGGVWGGDWNGNGDSSDERRADGMHFQFARLQ